MQPLQLSPRYSEALPMYYRLQQTLIDKIICQDWKAGMQLPSEREIAATMGITGSRNPALASRARLRGQAR